MPLYTYVIAFKGATHIAQSSHSNFRGFISWVDAVPNLGPALKKQLAEKAYWGDFTAVDNKKHVWRKSIDLDGAQMVVHAVQTQP